MGVLALVGLASAVLVAASPGRQSDAIGDEKSLALGPPIVERIRGRSVSMRSVSRMLVLAARSRRGAAGVEMPGVVEVDQGALGWSKPAGVPGNTDGVDAVAPADLADRVGQVVADGCR